MKRIFILLFSLSLLPLQSQLLWQVSGHGLAQPSYLFGTHHMIPISFLDSVPGLFRAFNRCDAVVGEMVMNSIDASEKIMQASTLPQGITMDSLLNADDYAVVDAGLRAVLKIGLKELALMKPAVIRTMYETELYRQHTGFDDGTQSDSYFQQIAMQQGKEVIGLEDVDTQIALLFGNADQKREALLLVLKEAVHDPYDYIDWWLWEAAPDYTVWSADESQSWCLKDPGDLYDYLVNES